VEPVTPRLMSRLVGAGSGTLDIVLENPGPVDADGPARLTFAGQIEVLDGVGKYVVQGDSLVSRTPPHVRVGERRVIGFVRGTQVTLAIP
jgi:hypothetical protein